MTFELHALALHARAAAADERARFAEQAGALAPAGVVLLQTCHRVEVFGSRAQLEPLGSRLAPSGMTSYAGADAARHLVRLAVGLESTVVAEDQVLHQLRRAVQSARARAPLAPALDRLFDVALRAGRRARTWLPARRVGLAELALRRVAGKDALPDRRVLVVGAGEMGRSAAHALAGRGATVLVSSRTPERAAVLATEIGGRSVAFVPEAGLLAALDGVVIALAGRWPLDEDGRRSLAEAPAWMIDLSAPPALDRALARALHGRLLTVDELAEPAAPAVSDRLMSRLEDLVETTVNDYLRWAERDSQRRLARALAERASEAQASELVALWQRMPELAPEQRAEVERMARHLTERLLRDPLELIDSDGDGRYARAARELFRL